MMKYEEIIGCGEDGDGEIENRNSTVPFRSMVVIVSSILGIRRSTTWVAWEEDDCELTACGYCMRSEIRL